MRNEYTFKKGHHIGRKKGSKAKVYLSLDYWFRHLNAEFMSLTPHQRAKISLEAFKALLAKTQSLPQDPSASLPQSQDLAKLVKELESSTETNKEKLNETKDVNIHPYDIPSSMSDAIPKSDNPEEAKAVLERHDITVSNPQSKIDPNLETK